MRFNLLPLIIATVLTISLSYGAPTTADINRTDIVEGNKYSLLMSRFSKRFGWGGGGWGSNVGVNVNVGGNRGCGCGGSWKRSDEVEEGDEVVYVEHLPRDEVEGGGGGKANIAKRGFGLLFSLLGKMCGTCGGGWYGGKGVSVSSGCSACSTPVSYVCYPCKK